MLLIKEQPQVFLWTPVNIKNVTPYLSIYAFGIAHRVLRRRHRDFANRQNPPVKNNSQ